MWSQMYEVVSNESVWNDTKLSRPRYSSTACFTCAAPLPNRIVFCQKARVFAVPRRLWEAAPSNFLSRPPFLPRRTVFLPYNRSSFPKPASMKRLLTFFCTNPAGAAADWPRRRPRKTRRIARDRRRTTVRATTTSKNRRGRIAFVAFTSTAIAQVDHRAWNSDLIVLWCCGC